MQSSDSPYKVLFQDPGLLEDTVRLIAPELADTLDFETAASLDKEHLTALALGRVQDKLHRVECKMGTLRNGRQRYVLVLIEFQSNHDAEMAWRIREYLDLVEADLREIGTVQAEGTVPSMLSILVHNGGRPWRATEEHVGPMTGDGPPPRMRMYATVDLQALAQRPAAEGERDSAPHRAALAPGSRLAMLAELESAPAERLPGLLLAAFRRYDRAESAGLRRGLHLRVEAALERLGVAERLPTLAECERMLAGRGGEHMTAMLEATLARWQESNVAEGEARGEARGEAQGRVAVLRRLAEWRFGANVASQVATLLADVREVSRLDEAGEWLLACDSGEALLARLRGHGDGAGNGPSR